jgi:hypothetical protein
MCCSLTKGLRQTSVHTIPHAVKHSDMAACQLACGANRKMSCDCDHLRPLLSLGNLLHACIHACTPPPKQHQPSTCHHPSQTTIALQLHTPLHDAWDTAHTRMLQPPPSKTSEATSDATHPAPSVPSWLCTTPLFTRLHPDGWAVCSSGQYWRIDKMLQMPTHQKASRGMSDRAVEQREEGIFQPETPHEISLPA